MKKIAITGNIASGKSTVEKIISDYGYKVIDADKVCHEALYCDDIANIILNEFLGIDILDEKGKIERKKLGNIIFASPEYKIKLEEILHPYVFKKINEFFEENIKEKAVFASVPLLFEAKMDKMFDKIILVYCDDECRLKRLIARNNYSKAHALSRINSQQKQDDKILLSDFVIYNNSDLNNLCINTKDVLNKLNLL